MKASKVISLILAVLIVGIMFSACEVNNKGPENTQPVESSTEGTEPVPPTTEKVPETTPKETEPSLASEEVKPSETVTEPAGEPQTLTLIAMEDAMVNFNKQGETSPTAPQMGLVGSEGNEKFGFFKFEVSGVTGEIDSAIFNVYCASTKAGVDGNTEVWSVGNSWTEQALSWETMPEKDEKIGEFKTPNDGEWAEVDLTDYIKGDGTYSFILIPTGEGRGFLATKDTDKGAELRPNLVINTK